MQRSWENAYVLLNNSRYVNLRVVDGTALSADVRMGEEDYYGSLSERVG